MHGPVVKLARSTWQGVPVFITRRAALGGLVGLGSVSALGLVTGSLAACGNNDAGDASVQTTTDAGEVIRQEVINAETALVALYAQAVAALPDLEPALGAIRDQHLAHAMAMGASADVQGTPPGQLPATAAEVLQGLIDAEKAAVGARSAACAGAPEVELTRVLALITASESSHIPYLTAIAGGQWP